MRRKSGIPLALFLGATLLSAWLSPALWFGRGTVAAGSPEMYLPGGMNGRTWLRSGEALELKVAGAPDVEDIEWRLDGRPVGSAPGLTLPPMRNGEHRLSLTYRDAQKQLYGVNSLIRVMSPEQYAIQAAAVQAAITLPLWEEDTQLFLPAIRR